MFFFDLGSSKILPSYMISSMSLSIPTARDAYLDRLLAQHVLDFFGLDELGPPAAVEEQMHADAGVDGHGFEELLVRPADDDIVSDVVLVGEVLEAGDQLVEIGDVREVCRSLGDGHTG